MPGFGSLANHKLKCIATMTKLSNRFEYDNPFFSREFAEFLLVNGFTFKHKDNSIHCTKMNKCLVIYKNNVDAFVYQPEEADESQKWKFTHSYSDIMNLDLYGWMSLLHDMEVIHILRFLREAKDKSYQFYTEAKFITNGIQ